MSPILIRQLKDINSGDFDACMLIYRESFPLAERQPESVIAERIKSGAATLDVCYDNDAPVGFALLYHLRYCECTLLDYFAVAAAGRAKGIGSILLKHVFNRFTLNDSGSVEATETPAYVVMEVEHPDFGDNKEQRRKRIAFYQKAGAVVLDSTRYLLPPLGDATSPSEMQLMIYPAPVSELPTPMINNLITRLYQQVYNRMQDDRLLQTLLR